MQVTDEMVGRFLAWELPKDFHPDGGVKFERKVGTADGERDRADMGPGWWPVGTNLLTADQARAMLTHVLASPPAAGQGPLERPVRPLLERLRDVERDGMTFAGEAANEIERLRAQLEVAQSAMQAAIRAAQWQARTNAELNALQDEVRKLRGEACRRLNDEFGV